MEEFDGLVAQICSSASSVEQRSLAEKRLLEILSDRSSWKLYSSILIQSNDTACFFICIGLQRLIWRHWREFPMEDQRLLNQIIVQTISSKKNMQNFAKSKLEQVLATICVNACSLEPVLGLLVEASHPEALTGLSSIRTVLDLVLSDDPKLIPDHKATLLTATQHLLTPLTNLACSSCSLALQAPSVEHTALLAVALEVLKTLTSKLQIGPHITGDVINLLFTVAELGADQSSSFHASAVSSMEILTEIMSKRYLPPSLSVPTNNMLSSSFSHSGKKDASSIDMLLDIVVKSVSLLKNYRLNGSVEDSHIVLSLLEFISVFAESHLERCISMSSGAINRVAQANGQHLPISGSGGVGGSSNEQLNQSISLFFEELVSISTVSMEPRVLAKIVSVWNRVITLGTVKDTLVCQPAMCLSIVAHLLQSCLTQTNKHLRESVEDLIEDFHVEGLVDPHMKEILAHLIATEGAAGAGGAAGGKESEVLGAEESSFVGSSLLAGVNSLIGELVSSAEVAQWLQSTTSQLLAQNIAHLSGSSSSSQKTQAAVDMCFIIRLLPMITSNQKELVLQLTNLTVQLMEARMHSYGKELLVLEISCCHIAGQILQSTYSPSGGADLIATMNGIFPILLRGLAVVCDTFITPCPHSIMVSVCVLLNQAIATFADLMEQQAASGGGSVKASVLVALNSLLDKGQMLPVEVYSLLICAHDHLDPVAISSNLMLQCLELAAGMDKHLSSSGVPVEKAQISALIRVCGAMDCLSRHHSLSKPQRRQCLVAQFSQLAPILESLVSLVFRQIVQGYSENLGQSPRGPPVAVGSLIQAATIVISLAGAVLQSLGKKTFGKAAADVLVVCVTFAENVRNSPASLVNALSGSSLSVLLFESSGLTLMKQMLELARTLAESTAASSSSASSQALVTHRLLAFVTGGLSDERVCAELLQLTLRVGIVAVGCYWQKGQRVQAEGPTINSSILSSPTNSSNKESSGLNVQSVVTLLTQLCVGSLGPSVPPQDTITALEGLISLSEQHQLFAVPWFQSQSWGTLLTPCLRAILLHIHNMHRDAIENLLMALAKAGLASYLSNGNETNQAKFQEFWLNIGREVSAIASECQCGEVANQLVYTIINQYSSGSSGSGSAFQGPASLDMRVFIDKVLNPVSAEMARLI